MAKPRIFISSTYYDLKQTREDLAFFLNSLGYETVRNEEGNIPYGRDNTLESYCIREINNVDILVSIIGGRFGSSSLESKWSISNEELRTAIKNRKQVYIFIDSQVAAEYETYLLNKGGTMRYKYVDNVKIYEFIEEIKSLTSNNNIKEFSTSSQIQQYLKEQLAGLFQSFLDQQSRMKDIDLGTKLENTANTLEKLVDYLKEANKGNTEAVASMLKSMHPFVLKLSEILRLRFCFWIDDFHMLKSLLESLGWQLCEFQDDSTSSEYYIWHYNKSLPNLELSISKALFADDKLKDVRVSDWNNDYIILKEQIIPSISDFTADNLPF